MTTKASNLKFLGLGVLLGIFLLGAFSSGVYLERRGGITGGDNQEKTGIVDKRIVSEESVVTEVVESTAESVVTVAISKVQLNPGSGIYDPFGFWGDFFGVPFSQPEEEKIEKDIGSGFIISTDGLVVTNKHVVSDLDAKYRVVVSDDKEYEVKDVYRDPEVDLAILKIEATDLKPLEMGDSDNLKVGQMVIAIGTALGEFRSTVTTGVISGLGRGIVAGSAFEGTEKLENVIQTDAAINPGNSGGPLLNSSGQVIGVNVAVSLSGQNIGFALPINMVKSSIDNFKATGEFDRPYLGVSYRIISKRAALLNEVPQGAYVEEVIANSGAEKAGIKKGDIITEIDGTKIDETENASLINIINKKKIGDTIEVKIWRDGQEMVKGVRLEKRVSN